MYAAVVNSLHLVNILLELGADPRLEDINSITALNMATDPDVRETLTEAQIEFTLKAHSEWERKINKRKGKALGKKIS